MARKRAKNLLLDPEALNIGEDYCRRHDTTLSRLVEDFLLALPRQYESEAKTAIVRRLLSAAMYGPLETDTYRDFLYKRQLDADYQKRLKEEDDDFS